MLLLLTVAAYLGTVVATVWATVASFRSPRSRFGRHPLWVSAVMAAEMVYMLQAPACVFLPRAPGKEAVRRHLLGKHPSGRLYWLEATAPMAFVWGPRWWGYTRPETMPFVPAGGGLDWVPPTRYAAWGAARWDVVCDDGRRWSVPGWHGSLGTMESGVPQTAAPDGTLLRGDSLRCAPSGGLCGLKPGARSWECVSPCGLPSLGFGEALAVTINGAIWEIFEPGTAGQVADRRAHGERLLTFRVRSSGAEPAPRVFELTIRQKPGLPGPSGATGLAGSDLALFLSASDGNGTVYRIQAGTQQVQDLGLFVFDPRKAPDHYTKGAFFAMADDATLFTTGQAIWDIRGTLVSELDPPLESAVWVGHTLAGVRAYPFFAHRYLKRSDSRSIILDHAARGLFRDDDRDARVVAAGLGRSSWIFGGVDESGREDEIVRFPPPAGEQ